jgi:Na+/melibiose symporter-like transporter
VGFAGSYALLFAFYCLMQFAGNTAQGPYQALLPDRVPADRRGRASAVKNLLEVSGGVVMVGLASVLISRYQQTGQNAWLWAALMAIAAVLLLALWATLAWVREIKPTGVQAPAKPILSVIRGTFSLDLRRDRPFLWFLASRTLVFMALATIQQFALYFFRDVVGLENPAEATFGFLGVAVAVMALGTYPAGRLSDRFSRQKISAAAAMLGAVAMLVILLMPKQYGLLLIPAGFLGLALVAFATTNWALATDLVAPGQEARFLGLANMATAGGAALGAAYRPGD